MSGRNLVLFIVGLIIAGTTSAQFRTWDGGGGANKNWSTTANWSSDTEPTSSNDALIAPGTVVPASFDAQITAGNDERANSLYIGGFSAPGTGTYGHLDMTGGTLIAAFTIQLGRFGKEGKFTQSGGTVGSFSGFTPIGDIQVGTGASTTYNTQGIYELSGTGQVISSHLTLGVGSGAPGAQVISGVFSQSGGSVILTNLNLTSPGSALSQGTYDFSSGDLKVTNINVGSGTAAFNWTGGTLHPKNVAIALANSGTGILDPVGVNGSGNPAGSRVSLTSDYTQGANGTLHIDIFSAPPPFVPDLEYDSLGVTGAVSLAGTLDVSLQNGFIPSPGQRFDIISFGSRLGTFDNLVAPPLPNGNTWQVDYSVANKVSLVVVPEPSFALPMIAAALLLRRRCR